MKATSPPVDRLTRREHDILALLGQQLTDREIAERLVLSLNSVKWYARQVYGKLGVANRQEAAAKARELGLISGGRPGGRGKHNLPRSLSTLIGREREIERVAQMVRDYPLVTLIGAGGVGKTRLGQAAAWELVDEYEGGVWFAALAPLADPGLVAQSLASTLGIRQEPGRSLMDSLRSHLANRSALVVLDNCEHLLRACAELVQDLLSRLPRLKILATSRELLGVNGEAVFYVPSLDFPKDEQIREDADPLVYASVRLFVERARAIQPGFELNARNTGAVVQICRRLDGIPLAIELAAARMRVLNVEQIAGRLDNAFHLLAGGSQAELPRHRTLRACIDWSYQLLSEKEQALLRRLSVFAGRWTFEAAEEVCSDRKMASLSAASAAEEVCSDLGEEERQVWNPDLQKGSGDGRVSIPGTSSAANERQVWKPDLQKGPGDGRVSISGSDDGGEAILDLLSGLVDKSLVHFEPGTDGEGRYRMLETVRQYARERLVGCAEEVQARQRHLDYYLALALRAGPHLRAHGAREWLDRLEGELDNIRVALEWSQVASAEKGLRIAAVLGTLWLTRGLYFEGAGWLERLLQVQEDRPAGHELDLAGKVARGRALNVLSNLITGTRNEKLQLRTDLSTEAEDRESQAIFEELGEAYLLDLAIARYNDARRTNNLMAKLACRDQFLALGDPFWTAECDFCIASPDPPEDSSIIYGEECLALYRQVGDLYGEGRILSRLASFEMLRGNLDRSQTLVYQSLHCLQMVGDEIYAAAARGILVSIAIALGDFPTAYEHIQTIRNVAHKVGSRDVYCLTLYLEAEIAWASGEYERAIRCCEEGLELTSDSCDEIKVYAFSTLAQVGLSRGSVRQARIYAKKILEVAIEREVFGYFFYKAIQILSMTAVMENKFREAVILFSAVETRAGYIKHTYLPRYQAEVTEPIATARSAMGEGAFMAAWEAGRRMTRDQIISDAREILHSDPGEIG